MPLNVGDRLGPYKVTAKIGEGGMGEVYQARDTTLDRDVALKVLPETFTADPDRLARFEREAKVLASLNHPNIGSIYGLEEQDGIRALVLELVEGPTLADRILKGPIPLDEVLPIARQIAEALEAAHEAGVIHRDLKPANIKVREDGTVKVLDFGLAKALDPNPEGDPSQSPTLTAAATQMGVILGTAAYMSPEQAAGQPSDKRSDAWSFGVVLYEMLTGQRLFTGETVSHVLAKVLDRDERQFPTSWVGDGNVMSLYTEYPDTARDLYVLAMDGDLTPELFLATPFQERGASFSPDGQGIAYVSNESGRDEVYVRPYPGPGGQVIISTGGGAEVVWGPDGSELLYRNGDQVMVVAVTTGQTFSAETPAPLFAAPYPLDTSGAGGTPNYDIAPDGDQFIFVEQNSSTGGEGSAQIHVVLNWHQELTTRVPVP